jgi:hypothetical protein
VEYIYSARTESVKAGLNILGKKRFLALSIIQTLDCPGNGLVAVFTHNFCECTACVFHMVTIYKFLQ